MTTEKEIEAATQKLEERMGWLLDKLGSCLNKLELRVIARKTAIYALEAAEEVRKW